MKGWKNESYRHSLAAKGVKTKRYMAHKKYMADEVQLVKPERNPGDLARLSFIEATLDRPLPSMKVPVLDNITERKTVRATPRQRKRVAAEIQRERAEASDKAFRDLEAGETGLAEMDIRRVDDLNVSEAELELGATDIGTARRAGIATSPLSKSSKRQLAEFRRREKQAALDRMEG